ncbi:MAG: PHB depolymerase family esterase [Gemmatimonadota bacterium]|jgi:poly(hydroxyalkanoate) depolymerase family esterase|nr:PHB depolymerase family esterase [Gemmatimonadota bacterium]
MRLAFLVPFPLLLLPVLSACAPSVSVGSSNAGGGPRFTTETFTGGSDARSYELYLPSAYDGVRPLPLVVMLHGCTQEADDFARGTRMNITAEEHGFLVAYPQQTAALHPQRCWRWYDAAHQTRDAGEPALIAGIAREVMRRHRVDATRVYVAGVSAGGAMAVILGATYPDLFAAIASHSGTEFGAARGISEALAAMQHGGAASEEQGAAAFTAMGAHARPVPLIVFHGGRDAVVHPVNAEQTVAQWRGTLQLAGVRLVAAEAAGSETGGSAPAPAHAERRLHRDEQGRVWIESWLVLGLGHAWSGGSPEGTYTDPTGPDATGEIVRFFLQHPRDSR